MDRRYWGWTKRGFLFLIFFLFSLQHNHHVSVIYVNATPKVHIVYMGETVHEDPATTKNFHHKMLFNLLGSKEVAKVSMLYSYRHGFSGFAARLTETQAAEIADYPGVVQVIPNRIHKLHTTRSWEFIGLNQESVKNLVSESNMGQGTIIGVIDSGIWPESKSFDDRGMSEIPSHWKGICQKGENFNSSHCNRKLIGARWFIKGLIDETKIPINKTGTAEFLSARDGVGHGTHTASTAAGYFVEQASYKGLASGLARGGAPLAHLAIYKACWGLGVQGCTDADLLKAFDKAIQDGVDILSLSIGSEIPSFSYVDRRDSIAIASFHATAKGIPVVCSAGNDGPISQTIVNTAPWIITVAATTIDRKFLTAITLGNRRVIWGQSVDIVKNDSGYTGITYSERIAVDPTEDSAKDCQLGSLNATLAAGKIIMCLSKSDAQDVLSASESVFQAGGVGLIFAQFHKDGLISCDLIPCVRVDYEAAMQILTYIRKAKSPKAKLSIPKTVIGKFASPRVASFSSRGPSSLSPSVLKPDIGAPGVDILAAYPPSNGDRNGNAYALLSGTSMACPHVAGILALIKSAHPNWSPSAIRSALVTTGSVIGTDGGTIREEGSTLKTSNPFDIGGGNINPKQSIQPGLIYDIATSDYINFLCCAAYTSSSISTLTHSHTNCTPRHRFDTCLNLNLPSITLPNLKNKVTVIRSVTNVGPVDSVYYAAVEAPSNVDMRVVPSVLRFNESVKTVSFKVKFVVKRSVVGGYEFGSLTWGDGVRSVRSPVSARVTASYTDV